MKLLLISGDRSVAEGKKGAFWYTLESFAKHWDRIDVICPKVKTVGSSLPAKNVFVHPGPQSRLRQPWWILSEGRRLHAEHGYDVMTVHDFPPFYNGLGAYWLQKETGIPYALEIHHIVGEPIASSFTERVGSILSRLFLARDAKPAKAVRTVNAEVAHRLQDFGIPSEKIHIVPSFYLDRDAFTVSDTEKQYDIVFAGRLVPNKGLPALITAVSDLPGVSLLVLGDGPERERAERLCRKYAIERRVTFTGWLPTKEDVISHLQKAKLFVMNSRSEGGPRIALEAMACGMPVIVTQVGVMPDTVEHGKNGLFTTGDAKDLRTKIQMLLESDLLREQLGSEAAKIIDRFDRDALLLQYASFLKSLV